MNTDIKTRISAYEARSGARFAPRAALLDMDGVLYDSMPIHERSWLEAAHMSGLAMDVADVYMMEGQTGSMTIGLLMQRTHGRDATADEVRTIYELKTRLFTEYNQGALIPDVERVLELLSPLVRVLVTGSSQDSLLGKLEANFPGVFSLERMVTGRDVRYGKPHPEPYLMGMERAGVAPHETIVVENAPRGVRSAHEAGCFTIAVNTGPLPDEVLWGEGADLVLPNMAVLAELLPDLLSHPTHSL